MTFPPRLLPATLPCVCLLLLAALAPGGTLAASASAPASTTLPMPVIVDLGFSIGIDAYLFFRIGDGAFPVPGGSPSSVSFSVTPSAPGGAPAVGNNLSTSWTGIAPPFVVAASGNVLPVEVRSNAGQVSLRATPVTPLASAGNTIAMSRISVASSDANLPAPPIPDAGIGAGVNVVSTSFAGAVTVRTANWTFTYANPANLASVAAGVYVGQVSFTASTP